MDDVGYFLVLYREVVQRIHIRENHSGFSGSMLNPARAGASRDLVRLERVSAADLAASG